MHKMIELHPTADALTGLGLPAIPYPVALPAFQAAVANDGALPLADMLHGLQLRAARDTADWQAMEPAMARLAELLAPDDARECISAEGKDWRLEVGPVDLGGDIIALQRGDSLLAALTLRNEGRLRLAAYRPLDGHAIELLLDPALARRGGQPADARHAPMMDTIRAGLFRWSAGLGIGPDDHALAQWIAQKDLPMRRPACVVAEIDTWHMLRG